MQNIIKDHIEHLIRRLARNPLLRFVPEGNRGVDLYEIFKGVESQPLIKFPDMQDSRDSISPEDFMRRFFGVEGESGISIDIKNKPIITRCRRLNRKARDDKRRSGKHSLYLGYPHIHFPNQDKAPLFIPLLLWPVSFSSFSSEKIMIKREGGVSVNSLFRGLLKHRENITLPESNLNEGIDLNDIPKWSKDWLDKWRACEKSHFDGRVERYTKPNIGVPRIFAVATIGYGGFKFQNILEELQNLMELKDEDMGFLEIFLQPKQGTESQGANPPEEKEKFLVAQADHTQEKAIWQSCQDSLILLHGPPGTGKSQTIVNLISDALSKKEKVVVVCHQKTALDVVHKRLQDAGLGDLVLEITDTAKQRQDVIERIKNERGGDLTQTKVVSTWDEERQELSSAIEDTEKVIEESHNARSYRSDERYDFADLMSLYHKYRDEGIDPYNSHKSLMDRITNYLPDSKKDLHKICEEITAYYALYAESSYPNNHWRNIKENAPNLNDEAKIRSELEGFSQNATNIINSGKVTYLHSQKIAWLAESSLLWRHYYKFVKPDHREPEKEYCELIHNSFQTLEPFFSNQDIRKFADSLKEEFNPYSELLNGLSHFSSIKEIHKLLREPLFKSLSEELNSDDPQEWEDVICALTIHKWRENLNDQRSEVVKIPSKEIQSLKDCLDKKLDGDTRSIRLKFSERTKYRDFLNDKNLLLQRKKGPYKKTEIRDLYHKAYGGIANLYPVLLTDPDSASQILPFRSGSIDLVIIDEASQMFMADAFPILYRAKRVVISGDNKQMPPPRWFFIGGEDGGDEEEEEQPPPDENRLIPAEGEYNLMNVAEHCFSAGDPRNQRLLTHYRSHHRELIDFSNRAFYNGELHIPNGNQGLLQSFESSIRFEQVAGRFDKGINIEEMNAVIEILREIWETNSECSTGVIVANTSQRNGLEERLEERAETDDDFNFLYERAREMKGSDEEDVGFFVRSIEHIQGDERDIIVLGTTYGQDSRNYGPLNTTNLGRRRLNVAITRARKGMVIVSSLNINAVANDGDRASGKERWYFWKYLAYAKAVSEGNKEQSLRILDDLLELPPKSSGEVESPFEEKVAEYLRKNDYHVDHQIGESGFRIDLGVKKKSDDPVFLCGIECDGRTYHSSWSARQRDIWRQKILEDKGWTIHRIWSDHWEAKDGNEKKRLLSKLKELAEQMSS